MTSNILSIGQQLLIPSAPSSYNTQNYSYNSLEDESIEENMQNDSSGENINQLLEQSNINDSLTDNMESMLNRKVDVPEEYKIKKGDSLWLIAKKYNTTVTELINYNELESINLKIDDILKIPTNKRDNRNYYIVEKGDTLWSIASSHNLSFQELKKINNLDNNSVTIGQRLIISDNNLQ